MENVTWKRCSHRMPTRTEIVARAKELYHMREAKAGNPAFDIEPELCELKEEGYLSAARSELMHSPAKDYEDQWKQYAETENFVDFSFDYEDALKSGIYCSGTTGTGKSDIAMYVAQELIKNGVIVIVFDSTQDWQMRSSIAQVQTLKVSYVESIPQVSTVFDISMLSVLQRQQLIERFCGDIYRYQAAKKPSERAQYFLVFEEAHNYFKEGFMRAKRFSDSAMLLSEGRNYNVRFMCITQFAGLIDKTVMRYMRQRYFGFTDEPNDAEYISRFFAKEDRVSVKETLRNLNSGEFVYVHGAETQKVAIEPYESYVSKTYIKPSESQNLPTVKTDYATGKTVIMGLLLLGFIIYMLSCLR
ncbi:MAG: hypothetical protein NWE95_07015 [Candidatus Bathyarchaeota archaeon]|nr:hypothetical protein [Candidatus Bathyarchaeota archaeon]